MWIIMLDDDLNGGYLISWMRNFVRTDSEVKIYVRCVCCVQLLKFVGY